jgi:2-polyprenyl-6-methoxyphenol hydroxylase-like FAD-dependent oxidoreductase
MSCPIQRDVVVVGGGWVGSAVALDLAQRGLGVTVLERHADVPDLLRGELVMPAGVRALERLGLGPRLEAARVETHGVRLRHPSFAAGELVIDYASAPPPLEADDEDAPWRPVGWCGWRRRLYEVLRAALEAHAAVEVITGFDAVGLERVGGGWRLEARDRSLPPVRAGLVVAADGAASRLRRRAGFRAVHTEQSTWVQGLIVRAPSYRRRRVQVGAHRCGAVFVFPFPDDLVRITLEHPAHLRGGLAGPDAEALHLQALAEALPDAAEELGDLSVVSSLQVQPGRTVVLSSLVDDGFALVGDAAGCLDPFAGYGMTNGLEDAAELAEVIAQGDWRAAALRGYEATRQRRFSERRKATDLLAYAFLDRTEGFGAALAARLAERWADPLVAPLVAAQFAGLGAPVEPSVGLELHCLGLL